MSVIPIVAAKMHTLPLEKQQEVLDFVEFLQTKIAPQNLSQQQREPNSFLIAAQEFAGCVDGGSSLSCGQSTTDA
jgi:hypothetical protein